MKRLISALAAVFVMTLCLTPAWGAEPEQHVFDNADIFTDAEEAELEKRIEQFQADVQADAVILTEQDGSVNDPELRAQDFYDANGLQPQRCDPVHQYGDPGRCCLCFG